MLPCESETLGPVLDVLHSSRTRPVCLDVLNEAAVRGINEKTPGLLPEAAPWMIVVGFEENAQAVSWQVQQLVKERHLSGLGGMSVRFGSTADVLWQALAEFQLRPDSRLSFKANMVSSATAEFCLRAAGLGMGIQMQAHAGNGIVIGHFAESLTIEQAAEIPKRLQAWASAGQGNVVLLRCPVAWKPQLPIWGIPRGDAWLMRVVREKLDPRQLFNPGRLG
jgi:hypothetical protein